MTNEEKALIMMVDYFRESLSIQTLATENGNTILCHRNFIEYAFALSLVTEHNGGRGTRKLVKLEDIRVGDFLQGNSIGTALLHILTSIAKGLDSNIGLWVEKDKTYLHDWYKKLGYEEVYTSEVSGDVWFESTGENDLDYLIKKLDLEAIEHGLMLELCADSIFNDIDLEKVGKIATIGKCNG